MVRQKEKGSVPTRNSSIELLRIIAMILIVGHHLYMHSAAVPVEQSSSKLIRFLFQMIFLQGGWVGDILFFSISAWFIAGEPPSLKKNLKRIWNLEREVLFWSATLLILSVFLKFRGVNVLPSDFSWGILVIKSILPTSTTLWWYVTSYTLFLLFAPFLVSGLKFLSQRNHALLALITLGLWGIGTLFPLSILDFPGLSVFTFMFWFILITYYRWYMKPLAISTRWKLLACGEMIYLIFWGGSLCIPWLQSHQEFIFMNTQLPQLLVSFSIFLLFESLHFSNKMINFIAPSTFAVYLIHQYPTCTVLLWQKIFTPKMIFSNGHPFINACMIALGLFFAFVLADLLRRALFHATIDRHKDKWFNRLTHGNLVKKLSLRIASDNASNQ